MHGHKDMLRVAPTYVVAILTAADDHSHHYLGKARLEFMLSDNFDALNACLL